MATISENAGSKVGWLENSNRSLRNTVLFKITANGPQLCLVAEYEATQYQLIINFNTRKYVRIATKTAIKYRCC